MQPVFQNSTFPWLPSLHCLEMLPALKMVMSNAEESEMASQLTLMDVLRCARCGAIFRAFLIKSLKEALVTEPIIGKMLYPI